MGKKVDKVIFRVFTDSGCDKYDPKLSPDERLSIIQSNVIALFPDVVADMQGNVQSYMHVGQHGAADLKGLLKDTRAAMPNEYKPLAQELRGIGYKLDIQRS